MSVTVAIPCYDQQRQLYRAIQSVQSQTVQPLEVLVIDDGTPIPIVLRNAKPYVKLIRVTNRGLPNARNVALMNAKGTAFLPLDADDWLEPTYIEKTYPLLKKADVVLTGIQEHGPTRNKSYKPGYDRPWQNVTADFLLTNFNRFFYCSLFRTKILRDVGGYNGRMVHGFEDWDLWIDLLRRKVRFAATDEPLFCYDTSNPNSMLSDANRKREMIMTEMRRHHQHH